MAFAIGGKEYVAISYAETVVVRMVVTTAAITSGRNAMRLVSFINSERQRVYSPSSKVASVQAFAIPNVTTAAVILK
jgi:hypothetical protein